MRWCFRIIRYVAVRVFGVVGEVLIVREGGGDGYASEKLILWIGWDWRGDV
jgi:hypothetical protein